MRRIGGQGAGDEAGAGVRGAGAGVHVLAVGLAGGLVGGQHISMLICPSLSGLLTSTPEVPLPLSLGS